MVDHLTEAELAKFQEAFYGKHGDGTLALEDVRGLAKAVDDGISDSDIQVCRA